jgi:hypothetical protein
MSLITDCLASSEGEKLMRKTVLLVIGFYLCTLSALAAPKDQSWSGWVSDSKCGVKGANASHAGCAKTCMANGEKPVLVTDSDQKVLAIENPAALAGQEGHHVQVSGNMTDNGALHVATVKQAQ